MPKLSYEEIVEHVLAHPLIVRGFCQNTMGVEQSKGRKEGGPEATIVSARCDCFRVCLYAEKKMADETKPSMLEAVAAAFTHLGLDLPIALAGAGSDSDLVQQGIEETRKEREFHSGYMPSIPFLRRRLGIGETKARAIQGEIHAATKLREKEETK